MALTGSPRLLLTEDLLGIMRSAVQAAVPEEACGIVIGAADTAYEIRAIENILHSPNRYQMESKAVLDAFISMEERNLELIAIFHSHPNGPPHPSQTDIAEAYYPDALQIIWYRQSGAWRYAAFKVIDGGYQEVDIKLRKD